VFVDTNLSIEQASKNELQLRNQALFGPNSADELWC